MSAKALISAGLSTWLTSDARLSLTRAGAEVGRRVSRKGHELLYFHRVDDPYCQLMVQVLPDFLARFNVKLRPKVVERLPANMYPDPERYEAYSILDATRLARLYGLGFPNTAMVPDRLAVGMANRFLASIEDDQNFLSVAEEVGAALWRHDLGDIRSLCGMADIGDDKLAENEKLLRALGHYASGTVSYGGEFYPGLDRLDHLERRLNRLGVGDDEVHFELTRLWRYRLETMEKSVAGKTVELFFSVRSPYSYLGLTLASELAVRSGIRLKLRPVMPMLMRGMKVPPSKSRYILMDATREARLEGIAFGAIVDPLGLATRRAMALGFALAEEGKELAFFKAFTRGVWAEGVDGASDKGLAKILARAGLEKDWLAEADATPGLDWEAKAEKNRQDMLMAGSWGVPTFRIGATTLWGQDRLWAVIDSLEQG